MQTTKSENPKNLGTFPTAGVIKGASLTHTMRLDTWTPLCSRVTAKAILDDFVNVNDRPTCPHCYKKDTRF